MSNLLLESRWTESRRHTLKCLLSLHQWESVSVYMEAQLVQWEQRGKIAYSSEIRVMDSHTWNLSMKTLGHSRACLTSLDKSCVSGPEEAVDKSIHWYSHCWKDLGNHCWIMGYICVSILYYIGSNTYPPLASTTKSLQLERIHFKSEVCSFQFSQDC